MRMAALNRRGREAKAWLMEACFPLWSEAGFDGALFREALDLQHRPQNEPETRVRVQARQTYVFALAAQLGWKPERALGLVGAGIEALSSQARRSDGLIGRALSTDGSGLVEDTADLYDTAFTLMALAEAARVMDDPAHPLKIAQDILASVDTHMRDVKSGGYAEWLPAPDIRQQNPHMHLFEACLTLDHVDPDGGHMTRAGELLSLFQTRFAADKSGLVAEYFAPDWSVKPGPEGDHIEPGHQFEWVWLLTKHARMIGAHAPPEALKLYEFSVKTCDSDGRVPQVTDRMGQPIDASRRTWGQTEALKAHLSMLETSNQSQYCNRAIQSFDILMDEYLTPEGGWIDHYDADGLALSTTIPASTGYHIVLGLCELIRITDPK